MERLLDRKEELALLTEAWTRALKGDPQFVFLWGRRRVGKTFLVSHFIRDKRAVYFGATQQSESVELSRLARAVARHLGPEAADLIGGTFTDWETALRFFAGLSRREPLVLVLDEVPYLARSTRGFASIVQVVWDHIPPGARLLLILTGSAFGTVHRMLGPRAPLRGRPTVNRRLDPLDPVAARSFLPRLDSADFIEAYAACGGYPLHLRSWDQEDGTENNLLRLAGTPGGILLEDAVSILSEELSEAGGYPRILAAVGRGRTRFNAIRTEVGQRIEHPLEVLVRVGFVLRSIPLGAPRRTAPLYEISDTYLAFWFGVLYSDIPQIEAGEGRSVIRYRRPAWSRHVGWVFEEAARAHAIRLVNAGALPDDLLIGRWWAATGEPAEVDVLGLRGSRTHLLGEARWQDRPLGTRDLEQLRRKVVRVPRATDEPLFALWGRRGVEPAVRRAGALGFGVRDVVRP